MSSLALEYQAVNLGQGFPDYPMSEELISLVNRAMKTGHNQYVHMNGLMELRESIAEKISLLYSASLCAEKEITITPGGTYAIYTSLTAVLGPADEVIVFEPAYDSYVPNIVINGATPVLIPLTYPDYRIDWKLVREKITPATRMIMINSPHNPTGSVLSPQDMDQLCSIVAGTQILISSDEVYEHLIFDDIPHESILKYPELLKRSFVSFSFGKVYNCTGWKIGYCVAPAHLMTEFRKVHQFNCFSCNSPVQYALAQFLKNQDAYLQLKYILQEKRDYLQLLMQQTKFHPIPSHGSYFQIYDYSAISNEKENDLAIRLTKEVGVTTIPVCAFYQDARENQVLRFCFSKKKETLEKAVERLIRFH